MKKLLLIGLLFNSYNLVKATTDDLVEYEKSLVQQQRNDIYEDNKIGSTDTLKNDEKIEWEETLRKIEKNKQSIQSFERSQKCEWAYLGLVAGTVFTTTYIAKSFLI